jgi:hypothetical protein
MKFEKNQEIKFQYISDFTGIPQILSGIIKGFGEAVRKKWPIECGEAPGSTLLVWRQDNLGQEFHYAVDPFDVVDHIPVEKEA